jgi:hypothetical protein
MDKGLKIFLAIVVPLGIIGIGFGVGAWYYHTKLGGGLKKEVDETKLYIGVPLKNGDQYMDLIMSAKGANGTYSKTVHSGELSKLDGQDEDLRFYDYAANPLVDLGGKTIGLWLSDPANSLTVKTVAMSLVTSKEAAIDKSGIWFINAAAKDGADATMTHSYVYTNWVLTPEANS